MTHIGKSSTPVSFRGAYPPEGPVKKFLYTAAEKFLTANVAVDHFFSKRLEALNNKPQANNFLTKAFRSVQTLTFKAFKSFGSQVSRQDYVGFPTISKIPILGRLAAFAKPLVLSTPGKGAAVMLYYIGLIYPRAHRAWERGVKPDGHHDRREMMDVFRRDFWAITVFVYGLGLVTRFLTHWREKKVGVRLFNEEANDIYKYYEHDINAKISTHKVLEAHFLKGNKQGLLNAANGFYLSPEALPKEVRKDKAVSAKLQALADQFRNALNEMSPLEQAAQSTEKDIAEKATAVFAEKAAKAFEHLSEMDTIRADFIKNAPQLAAKLEKRWPEFKNFFAQYAKNQRAPLDLLGFGIIIILLGYAPVKVNEWWNNRMFEKEKEAEKTKQHAAQAQGGPHAPITQPALSTPILNAPLATSKPLASPWQGINPALLAQPAFFPASYASGPQ